MVWGNLGTKYSPKIFAVQLRLSQSKLQVSIRKLTRHISQTHRAQVGSRFSGGGSGRGDKVCVALNKRVLLSFVWVPVGDGATLPTVAHDRGFPAKRLAAAQRAVGNDDEGGTWWLKVR